MLYFKHKPRDRGLLKRCPADGFHCFVTETDGSDESEGERGERGRRNQPHANRRHR